MALGQPKQSGWLWDSKFAIQWTSGAVPKVSGWPWDIRMSMRQPLATPKPSGHLWDIKRLSTGHPPVVPWTSGWLWFATGSVIKLSYQRRPQISSKLSTHHFQLKAWHVVNWKCWVLSGFCSGMHVSVCSYIVSNPSISVWFRCSYV